MILAYEQAVKLMNQHPELQHFVGKRDSALVDWAEKMLGVIFPPSYRRFLLEYGAGGFGSEEFYGVIDNNLEKSSVPDGIWLTLNVRKYGLAPHLIWVHGVEFKYYLATGKNPDEEVPILTWDFSFPKEDEVTQLEIAAPSFGEFFLAEVQEVIARANRRDKFLRSDRGHSVDLEALFKSAFEDD